MQEISKNDTIRTDLQETNTPNSSFKEGLSIEIIGGVIAGIIIILIVSFWNKLISHFTGSKISKLQFNLNHQDIRRKLKIIVIDDDDIFPVSGFKEFGYSIDRWEKLDEIKHKRLIDGEFDIIILDIYGVAKDIARNDGLDILQDIKTKNPSQVVVAYSGHSFDFSKNKFWELADEKLTKPTPFVGTQEIIDQLIDQTFNVQYHIDHIKSILKNNNATDSYNRVEKLFLKHKKESSEPNWFSELNFLTIKDKERLKIASILRKLFKYSHLS